jgi:predicted DNA-binding ribbon-helix-helix protein
MTAHLRKRSLALAGHRTSVALEAEFWCALEAQARACGETLAALVTRIDGARDPSHPLASALRIEALRFMAAVKQP